MEKKKSTRILEFVWLNLYVLATILSIHLKSEFLQQSDKVCWSTGYTLEDHIKDQMTKF